MTTIPTPDHTSDRFTDNDRARIRQAIAAKVAEWTAIGATGHPDCPVLLRRVAMHSIGCTSLDLRDVELDWIDARCSEALAA